MDEQTSGQTDEQSAEQATEQTGGDRYLVFRVGKATFAAPLLSIREIVEPLPCRAVPNTPISFLGLVNLRGQIVGVMDLGICFGLEPVCNEAGGVLLVFDYDAVAVAGLASSVEAVTHIPQDAITTERLAQTEIPESALLGTADIAERLIPLVDLKGLIQPDVSETVAIAKTAA